MHCNIYCQNKTGSDADIKL